MNNEENKINEGNIQPAEENVVEVPVNDIQQPILPIEPIIPSEPAIHPSMDLTVPIVPVTPQDSSWSPVEPVAPVIPLESVIAPVVDNSMPNMPAQPEMPIPVSLDTIIPVQPEIIPVMPIPEPIVSASATTNNPKPKNNKILFIILGLLIVLVVAILIYFLVLKKDNKNNNSNSNSNSNSSSNSSSNSNTGSGYEWDPSTSKIKEVTDAGAIKLLCKKTSEIDDLISATTVKYIYKEDVFIQAIIDDEIIFNENSIKYYGFYLGSAEDELLNETKYDNIISEIQKKKMSISYVYSVDMTADPENQNNLLTSKTLSYESAKTQLMNEGYICE